MLKNINQWVVFGLIAAIFATIPFIPEASGLRWVPAIVGVLVMVGLYWYTHRKP